MLEGRAKSNRFRHLAQISSRYEGENAVSQRMIDTPASRGRVRWVQLRDGLLLHASDAEHLRDQKHEAIIPPGLGIYLFFEESDGLNVTMGNRPLPIGKNRGDGERPIGFIVCRRQPVRFVREAERGSHVRKICVMLSPDWIDETFGANGATLPTATREHLAVSRWFPSYRLSQLANELFDEGAFSAISRLRDETIALEMIAEALQTIRPPSAREGQRTEMLLLNKARDLIEARLGAEMTVDIIAAEIGTGVGTLQRMFKQVYGYSAHKYLQDRRLDAARTLIENGESVASASAFAGYRSSANFATAFRRRFGITPSCARDGIKS